MATSDLAFLQHEQFISLTTFRKDGRAVPTAVWFALDGARIIVMTPADTGKAKRIRNNSHVTVAPCARTGTPTGAAFDATATFLPQSEEKRAMTLLDKKYGFAKRLANLVIGIRRLIKRGKVSGNVFLVIEKAD